MVIKSFTVTALVNAADAPLLMVKSLMATDVPVIAPTVPALSPRLNAPVMPVPKRIFAPAAEPVIVATVELPVSVTLPEPVPKLITSPELVMAAPTLDIEEVHILSEGVACARHADGCGGSHGD